MSHDRDLADQDIEEVAEELWTLGERGLDRLADLRETTQVTELDQALAVLAASWGIRNPVRTASRFRRVPAAGP